MLGLAMVMVMDMSAPEYGSTCMYAEPLGVEMSAWMVGAGWIPACDVLIEGVTWTSLVVGSCGWGLVNLRDLQTLAR